MKKSYLIAMLGTVVVLGACEEPQDAEQQVQPEQEQIEQGQEAGQQEAKDPQLAEQLKERLPDWNIALPSWTAEESRHIGAAVVEEADRVEIQFYKTDGPMKVDDPALEGLQETALLTIEHFSSSEEANEQVGFQDYKEVGGEPVDLGHGITGYQDAGAGSLFTSWNEGRWAIVARTTTDAPEEGVQLARRTVSFLEEHTLPIPYEHGSLHLDVNEQGSLVKWQKEELVYGLTAAGNEELLEWAVRFE
ncbi:MAG: hypothetical protein ACI33P_12000 [Lysinibacillus sp.]